VVASDHANGIREPEQRLALIRWLWRQPGYTSNEEHAGAYLKAVGLGDTHAVIRKRFKELEAPDLVAIEMEGGLMVVTLTRRGAEAAEGLLKVQGVRPPGPECAY
jgi:hypothetical protein